MVHFKNEHFLYWRIHEKCQCSIDDDISKALNIFISLTIVLSYYHSRWRRLMSLGKSIFAKDEIMHSTAFECNLCDCLMAMQWASTHFADIIRSNHTDSIAFWEDQCGCLHSLAAPLRWVAVLSVEPVKTHEMESKHCSWIMKMQSCYWWKNWNEIINPIFLYMFGWQQNCGLCTFHVGEKWK